MTDIFLSYSSKDRERVQPLRDALALFGYDVFWDVEVPLGENWDQWIRRHIVEAKLVIVFWTKNSANSVNVQHEAAIAREDNKLIPALLENMRAVDFPMGFYTTQAADIHDWNGSAVHSGYAKLVRAVRQRFESTPAQIAEVAKKEDAADVAALESQAVTQDTSAQTELAYRYLRGQGVAKNAVEARRLLRLAAEAGSAAAQFTLGLLHETAEGGAADKTEAARLYGLAAAQGYARAQCNLGTMYENGEGGLPKDDVAATELYKLAAEQADASGQFNFANMLYYGLGGLSPNEKTAMRYFRLAAQQGHAEAQAFVKKHNMKW